MMTLLPLRALPLVAALISLSLAGEDVKIYDAQDLIDLSNKAFVGTLYENATVFLENDIDFAGLSSQFKPIGNETNPFCGTFDGQGYKISNLVIDSGSFPRAGFFGYSQGASIRNLVLDDTCSITSSCTTESTISTFVGGIIGCCYAMRKSCITESNVNMAAVSFNGNSGSSMYMGGIVGQLYNEGKNEIMVRNCINYGSVTYAGSNSLYTYVGGIVGEFPLSDSSTTATKLIQNCINYGAITSGGTDGNGNNPYVGGIVGVSNKPSKIEACVNVGQIEITQGADTYVGSIVGYVYSDTEITICYWVSETGYDKLYGDIQSTATVERTSSDVFTIDKPPLSTLNLYGGWGNWILNRNGVPVIFHTNGGSGYTFTSQKLILLPSLVESTGLNFSGWYTDITCTSKLGESIAIISTINIDLYGGWKYAVSFNENGGNSSQSSKDVVYGQHYGPLPGATKTGYALLGWFTNITGGDLIESDTIITTADDHTLHAQWSANTYTVTFEGNGGISSQGTKNVTYDEPYGELPEATRTGYTFIGWFTNITGGDLIESDTNVTITGEQTLYAQWSANTYTVTFDGNNGISSQGTKNVTYDEPYGDLGTATRIGYTFLGWYTDITGDDLIESDTIITTADDHTLHAHWTANTYTVTFDGNNGISSKSAKNVTYDEPYGELPEATRTGYTFIGWYTDVTGGDLIESDTNVTITSDQTLYAHWMTNNYTVTFKIDNKTTIEKVFQFNATIEYPKKPEKEGFMFAGWDNNIELMPANNVTINALWNETTQFVEIVFNTKDMSKEQIEKIIEEYVGTDFTIVEYENKSGETRVIVKFNDVETAKALVEYARSDERKLFMAEFTTFSETSYSFNFLPLVCFFLWY